jgi:hypothetical protein
VELSLAAVTRIVAALDEAAVIDPPPAAQRQRGRAIHLARPGAVLEAFGAAWARRRIREIV